MGQEGFVFSDQLQLRLVDPAQHQHGVVAGGFPEVAIEAAEELDGVVIPCPAEVVGQQAQSFEGRWQGGHDVEAMNGAHDSV